MQLDILTPEQEFFSGDAEGVQLPGIGGSFEILNNHAPIISALEQGVIRVNTSADRKFIRINSGFVECLNNKITVLVEGASTAKDAQGTPLNEDDELDVI